MGVVDRDSDYSGFLIEQVACANDIWMCDHEFGYEIGETGYTDLLDFLSKYRLLAATNFEFVAVRVFEKEGVVTRTVVLTNFWPLKVFPASVAHEFRNPIHFFARVRPKRDPRAVGTMVFVLIDTEKFHRPIGTPSIERMKIGARTFVNESKLRQKFSVELSRHFHAFHPQIDVIKATRFHFLILNRMA